MEAPDERSWAAASDFPIQARALILLDAEISQALLSSSDGYHRTAPSSSRQEFERYQGSRPMRAMGVPSNAGLAAPCIREQGHLMIWPLEHRYRRASGGSIG